LFFSFKTRKQIFTVEVEVMLVVANLTFKGAYENNDGNGSGNVAKQNN